MSKYYEAYDLRYRQVHAEGLEWFGGGPTPIVAEVMDRLGLPVSAPVLEIGCGEGGDAAFLLQRGRNVLATDVSEAAVAFCREKYPRWADRFRTLDALKETLDERFSFIYAVAVLHMLVLDEDRQALLSFIREHLTEDGFGLLVVMGNGEVSRATDVNTAFDVQQRMHERSGRMVEIASTSCRLVTWEELSGELAEAGLAVAEKGNTSWDDAPFAMYALVKRK